jgi:hypothetical protein
MAIEREILKDITEYEAHLIGPLTIRQTVCVVAGSAIAVPVYWGLSKFFVDDISVILAVLTGLPFWAAGFWKPYGVPLEKFAFYLLQLYFLCPTNRKYKTDNLYKKLEEPKFVPKKISRKEKKALKQEMEQWGYQSYI